MKNLSVLIALVAGLTGGIFSHYLWTPVQADPDSMQKVVSAQSFALVGPDGKTVGVFTTAKFPKGTDRAGARFIVLFDSQGRELWRAADRLGPILMGQ